MLRIVLLVSIVFGNFINSQNLQRLNEKAPFSSSMELNGIFYDVSDTGNNTELNEVGCTVFREKYLLASNKQRGFVRTKVIPATGQPNNNIFCADIIIDNDLDYPLIFSKVLNSTREQSSVIFTPDEQGVYYTRSKPKNHENFSIYRGDYNKKYKYQWDDRRELKINSDEYSIETPFIPKKEPNTIYLSSNMPGGYGGFDLYKGEIDGDGEIINLVNLGAQVNSNKDEKYPFVDDKNQRLFFSSNRAGGEGGYDVYRVSILKDEYKYLYNIGNTINTSADEISFYMLNEYNGYVSANHIDTPEDFNIYKFQSTNLRQTLEVTYVDEVDNKPLSGVFVSIYDEFGQLYKKKVTNNDGKFKLRVGVHDILVLDSKKRGYIASINQTDIKDNNKGSNKHEVLFKMQRVPFEGEVVDIDTKAPLPNTVVLLKNAQQELILEVKTDEEGKFIYDQMPKAPFSISISKEGYFMYDKTFDKALIKGNSMREKIELTKEEVIISESAVVVNDKVFDKIMVENIFFDFDKSTIKEESHKTLHRVYNLLKTRPDIDIVINAHTDTKGSAQYNLRLSKKRALSVYRHLIAKGVGKDRLKVKFYGMTMPLIECGSNCSDEQNATNRRVEFLIQNKTVK